MAACLTSDDLSTRANSKRSTGRLLPSTRRGRIVFAAVLMSLAVASTAWACSVVPLPARVTPLKPLGNLSPCSGYGDIDYEEASFGYYRIGHGGILSCGSFAAIVPECESSLSNVGDVSNPWARRLGVVSGSYCSVPFQFEDPPKIVGTAFERRLQFTLRLLTESGANGWGPDTDFCKGDIGDAMVAFCDFKEIVDVAGKSHVEFK